MNILEKHLSDNCDARLPGLLNYGVAEAYKYLHKLINNVPALQHDEMRKTYGYLRNALVDIALRNVLSNSKIEYKLSSMSIDARKNSYTYSMLKVKGGIIIPVKTGSISSFPKKANYRNAKRRLNYQLNLFESEKELDEKYDNQDDPFLMLTYGGKNYNLDFVSIGLPNASENTWIDSIEITNTPVMVTNQEETMIHDNLDLEFTPIAQKMLGEDNNGQKSI